MLFDDRLMSLNAREQHTRLLEIAHTQRLIREVEARRARLSFLASLGDTLIDWGTRLKASQRNVSANMKQAWNE
jgi:hypothetical protein